VASSSTALARCSIHEGAVVLHWMNDLDHPWLSGLIEVYTAFIGEPRHRLEEHLTHVRAEATRERAGWKLALQALDRVFPTEVVAALPPPSVRAAVFEAAAPGIRPRAEVFGQVAADLNSSQAALETALFADLPSQRILRPPEHPVHAPPIALRCNLAIAQAALKNSSKIALLVRGNSRAVVRHAKLRGLICTVSPATPAGCARLDISGPLALFRKTALYGRHLAELVPLLPWCASFELQALCSIRGRDARLTLSPADPIPPGPEPRRYDSLLEERFARDFTRAAPEWELLREPEPIPVDRTLIFPDFALLHRTDPDRRWLVEIIGFWTPDYVEQKLRRLGEAQIGNLILCIDASLNCGESSLPEGCPVIRFRKRVDPREVLKLIE